MFEPDTKPRTRPKVAVLSSDYVLVLDIREMLDAHGLEPVVSARGLGVADFSLFAECIAAIVDVTPRCNTAVRLIEWFRHRNVPLAVLGSIRSVKCEEAISGALRLLEKPVIVESLLPDILHHSQHGRLQSRS